MTTIDIEANIGFRFYCEEYLNDLLATKVSEIPGMPPWMFVGPKLLPAVKRFFSNGLFLCRVLDDGNYAYCQTAFIKKQSVDISIVLHRNENKLKVQTSDKNKIRFLSTKAARETFQKDAEANGSNWNEIEKFVTMIVDKLYGERIFVCCSYVAQSLALHEALKVDADIDLKILLQAPE